MRNKRKSTPFPFIFLAELRKKTLGGGRMNCDTCIYCKPVNDDKYSMICLLNKKMFNHPKFHGWLCDGLGNNKLKKKKYNPCK